MIVRVRARVRACVRTNALQTLRSGDDPDPDQNCGST
jgi:hypothetical protein